MDTEYVIDSIEISKIVKMKHSKVLRKIQGANDRKGFIQYLKSYGYELENYLRLSQYNSKQGKVIICYEFTRQGWHVFINLFTGDRGNILSDAYVRRFGILKNQTTDNPKKKGGKHGKFSLCKEKYSSV